MWKPEHRQAACRKGLRYDSDLTDAEWALVEPLIPPSKHGGRKRDVDVREILNAIFYVLWTGCQWKALPKDLPPKSTVHWYFMLWTWDGTLEQILHGPSTVPDGSMNLMGALRRTMATAGYSDLKEFQRVEVVVTDSGSLPARR